mgnify:CR=1 FL=1
MSTPLPPVAPDTPAFVPPSKLKTLWVVIREGGDRHHIDREPDEGIEAWAKGQDIIVLEYTLTKVVHQRQPKKASK